LIPSRATLLALPLAVLVLTGATCQKQGPGAQAQDAAKQPPAPPRQAQPHDGQGASAAEVEGLDLSQLAPPVRRELEAVFADQFCHCGCPHSLGACLREHPGCRHAKRMARLSAAEAAAGAHATEIIVLLSGYYQSFSGPRAKFELDPRMCKGPPEAKVTLVEFSDFQCPYCAQAQPFLAQVAKAHPEVRFCFLPFALQGRAHSTPAAQAVLFAREKGKFWELHDALFEHPAPLDRERLLALGRQVGLDAVALGKAIDGGAYLDELGAFRAAGRKAGMEAVPTVFVNGRKLVLPLTAQMLGHTLEDELEWVAAGGAWAED
jgi:protein-disulfide isomerase